MEKGRPLRGLAKKRTKIYEGIIIVEKNPIDIMIVLSIYYWSSNKFD